VSQQLAQAEKSIRELVHERDGLRTEVENQRQKLEAIIKSNPAEELQRQISNLSGQLQIKDDIVRSADQKYRDITAALSVNQSRRRTENPIDEPDIKPDIFDDLKDLSGDDIENRILDYKFGIRKDIV